jgi:hypothetical protein
MGPLLIVFGEKPLLDCIKKVDAHFGWDAIESWSLLIFRDLIPYLEVPM